MSKKNPVTNEQVTNLIDKIADTIKVDATTGLASVEKDPYKSNLPEGVTPELADSLAEYNVNFVAASRTVFGQAAVTAMEANKELEKVTVKIPLAGKDAVNHTTHRRLEYPNPSNPTGDKVVKWGVTKSSLDIIAGDENEQMLAAREKVRDLAEAKLAGK